MELLLASSNEKKARELTKLLYNGNIRVVAAPHKIEVLEDGDTFIDNARKKAITYYEKFNQITLSDDSGLIVKSLPDQLGVKSARYGGENKKGYDVIDSLVCMGLDSRVSFVCSSRDSNVKRDYFDEIEAKVLSKGIDFYQRGDKIEKSYTHLLAIGWRWMIKDVSNLIVLHDSILPRYRGFAPLVNALINKEKKLGVTALYASDAYDQGPIIDQEIIEINYPLRIKDAIDLVSELYVKLVLRIFSSRTLMSTPQDESIASYSVWRDEDDYFVDWTRSSQFIKRFVDAVGVSLWGSKNFGF